ncbi:MAG: trans-aconitate 2-methyltransferase [Vicinamibacterales bacterium]
MSDDTTYRDYVASEKFGKAYARYQRRYASSIRESDRVILGHVGDVVSSTGRDDLALLDIGCSTGNLLLHLRHAYPRLRLVGGDIGIGSLESCRANPDLGGVEFREMDVLRLDEREAYDIVTVNAVFPLFDDEEFESALTNVASVLRPGGVMIVFDWFHPWEQDLTIVEKTPFRPLGLKIRFRPYSLVRRVLGHAGFGQDPMFAPFAIPIDLPRGQTFGDNADGFEDLNSYTIQTATGERMLFRGTLFQPWCHMVAHKA